uniref:Uncharacterized protein n=1 Tax=Triticum urartu TaxID=4572 RepID=A0A8R7R0K9_TRIUA
MGTEPSTHSSQAKPRLGPTMNQPNRRSKMHQQRKGAAPPGQGGGGPTSLEPSLNDAWARLLQLQRPPSRLLPPAAVPGRLTCGPATPPVYIPVSVCPLCLSSSHRHISPICHGSLAGDARRHRSLAGDAHRHRSLAGDAHHHRLSMAAVLHGARAGRGGPGRAQGGQRGAAVQQGPPQEAAPVPNPNPPTVGLLEAWKRESFQEEQEL